VANRDPEAPTTTRLYGVTNQNAI